MRVRVPSLAQNVFSQTKVCLRLSMRKTLLYSLFQRLGAVGTLSELEDALTHASFYVDADSSEAIAGSRYVFLGQFAFKGEVARYLSQWISGTGQQLQHFLGNLFKNEHLERLYEQWELQTLVRCADTFPVEKHRHIFAYAILGFLYRHTAQNELQFFINKQFFAPYQHLLAPSAKGNLTAQLRLKCYQVWNQHPKISVEKDENNTYKVRVKITEKLLAEAESKSEVYARKKALKKALIAVIEEEISQNEVLQARIEARKAEALARKEAEQKAYEAEYLANKQSKQAERETRKKAKAQAAKLQDAQRRQAKKNAKERAEKTSETQLSKKQIEALLEKEGHLMSSAKRRRLEDKLK